ncbi:MAG: response regulator [Acidobacteria bacterium]|nr:response regulator [Acidobacteriota bacterium]
MKPTQKPPTAGKDQPNPDTETPSVIAAFKELVPSPSPHPAKPTPPTRVLVVDDEEAVRTFVVRVLRDAGYQTAVASDGVEALKVAAKLDGFEVLVTDVMMPNMTGDELARRLRLSDPTLKVLYLTGFSDHLFKEKSTLWEGEAFLDKPCSVKGLQQAVSLLATGTLQKG